MIRRDQNGSWLLISQIDHARIAAEMAVAWQEDLMPPLRAEGDLVRVIRDHDEGWRAWERAPEIDPRTGMPRDFTEMPLETATGIWTESIEACAAITPFGGCWVSRHFCWLAERARPHRPDGSPDALACDAFLTEQSHRQRAWRDELEQAASPEEVERRIERGFRLLQFFDRLSLWLCCRERTDPDTIDVPDGPAIRLIPQADGRIAIEPYPLNVERLVLEVPAQRIAARRYSDDAELRRTLMAAPHEALRWELGAEAAAG